jgi:hypothetical protein
MATHRIAIAPRRMGELAEGAHCIAEAASNVSQDILCLK